MFINKPYFEAAAGNGGGGGDAGLNFESVEAAIAALEKDHGLTIRNKEQETEFKTNIEKQIADDKSRELYSTFENEIERITGVKRDDGEKAYDFLKRSWESTGTREKELSKQVDDLNATIKKLQADGGTAGQIDELNKQLATLKDMHKKEIEKRDNEINGMKAKQFEAKIDSNINGAVGRYRVDFDKDKGDEIIEPFVSAQIAAFKGQYKPVMQGDVIIWHDINDKPQLDPKTGNPLGAYDLLEPMLKPILKEKRTQGGAGGDGGAGGGAGGDDGAFVLDPPTNITTKTQLIDWMRNEKQMDHKSPDFNKYYMATVTAKKIEKA